MQFFAKVQPIFDSLTFHNTFSTICITDAFLYWKYFSLPLPRHLLWQKSEKWIEAVLLQMFQPIIKTLWTLPPCLCFSQKRIEKSMKRKIRSTDIPLKMISLNFQSVLRSLSTLNMFMSLTHWRSMVKVVSMGLEIIFEFLYLLWRKSSTLREEPLLSLFTLSFFARYKAYVP